MPRNQVPRLFFTSLGIFTPKQDFNFSINPPLKKAL